MASVKKEKADADWETVESSSSDSSDSDSDDDFDSSSDEEAINNMLKNMDLGSDPDFTVFSHGPQSSKGSHTSGIQHPKGLRGREAADYWRNYGKMKKANVSASDKKAKKEKKEEKRLKKAAKKDPQYLPSLYISGALGEKLGKALQAYKTWQRDAGKKAKIGDQRLRPAMNIADDSEMLDWAEDEIEEWQDMMQTGAEFRPPVKRETIDHINCRRDTRSIEFMDELSRKESNPAYQEMMRFRKKLPAFAAKTNLLQKIRTNQVCVVSGETGCGKTTQLPQFILDEWIERGEGAGCTIVCTQPRRISAISVSERIAKERSERLGISVGYQIRLEKVLPREQGSILMCTTGVLLQWLNSNSSLQGVSHIIVDEIHEQDILSDFLLIILKDLRVSRPDLRIILMSATINAEKFSEYFGGPSVCPLINIPGFTFPVKELYLEQILANLNYIPVDKGKKKLQHHGDPEWGRFLDVVKKNVSPRVLEVLKEFDESVIDFNLLHQLVKYIVANTPEDEAILIFLPGWEDIKKMNTALEQSFGSRNSNSAFLIIPLHSMMPTINQRQVFERPEKKRKIVIATSIAETSITIDDIVHVIDTGKIKMKDYDVERNLSTLMAQWVTVSNARQRKGRAGRVKSGICYHMYTSFQFERLQLYPVPEMRRTRLDELGLQLKLLRLGRIAPFVQKAMEPPSAQAVEQAVNLLTLIGALDSDEELTPLGDLLAHTPVPPQLGKMMFLGCIFGCINPILNIAAVLGYRDPFCTPLGQEENARRVRGNFGIGTTSDHIMYHEAIEDYWRQTDNRHDISSYCWDNYMFPSTIQQIIKMKNQFAHILAGVGFLSTPDPLNLEANRYQTNREIIRAVVCAGLYPNVGTMKKPKNKHMGPPVETKKEGKTCVHPKSIFGRNCQEAGIVAFFNVVKTSKIFIHDITLLKSNLPVAVFCNTMTHHKKKNIMVVTVDGWLEFRCIGAGTPKLLDDLKKALEDILLNFYRNAMKEPMCQEGKTLLQVTIDLFSFRSTA